MNEPDASAERHIVDVLIEERAGRLLGVPGLWPLLRTTLLPLLRYRDAVSMADAIRELSGADAMRYIATLLAMQHQVHGLDRVPADGPLLLVGNHPTGIPDGIALFDALGQRRPDLALFANRDAIRVAPRLDEVIIPVEWSAGKKTRTAARETLKAMKRAFSDGRAIVLFPAGRIAVRTRGGVRDHPWQNTAVTLAQRYGTPIVPFHIDARASRLFYLFRHISDELRDITVFYELLAKTGARMTTRIAPPIDVTDLCGDADELTRSLQQYVEFGIPKGVAFTGARHRPRITAPAA